MKLPHPPHIPVIAVILAAVSALPALSQKLGVKTQQADCVGDSDLRLDFKARYRALREIEDPGTHQRWLLIQDRERAAGPALFVKEFHRSQCALFALATMNSGTSFPVRVRPLPVIHAGDPVIVSEHTKVSDAELEATALEPAAAGDPLRVRIKFGGFTARAIATAPGRATLTPEASGRRP